MSADTAANRPARARTLAGARPTHVRWYVLVLISLMYMITYMDRSNISIAARSFACALRNTAGVFMLAIYQER